MSQFKICLLTTLLTLLVSTGAVALANEQESTMTSQLLEQVFNSIDESQLDIEIDSIRINSETEKIEKESLAVNGIFKFSKNWQVILMKSDEKSAVAKEMRKIYPIMSMDAAKLYLSFSYLVKNNNSKIQVDLYDRYDKKSKNWIARPMTIQVSNQLNKSLFKIRIHRARIEITPSLEDETIEKVIGTCESDKESYDLTTGKVKRVPMNCLISGTKTAQGYQLQVTYNNKK